MDFHFIFGVIVGVAGFLVYMQIANSAVAATVKSDVATVEAEVQVVKNDL